MKFRLRFILILLVLVNSMGYDWLHTMWHIQNGPRLYPAVVTGMDMPSYSNDDSLEDASQPGNSDLSASEPPKPAGIRVSRILEPVPYPTTQNNRSGFPCSVFKPPRNTESFV